MKIFCLESDIISIQTYINGITESKDIKYISNFISEGELENYFPQKKADYYFGIFDFDNFISILEVNKIKLRIDSLKPYSARIAFFKIQEKNFQAIETLDIESHPTLYHYTKSDTAKEILTSNSLMFSNREKFNDNFDTRLHECNFINEIDLNLTLLKSQLKNKDIQVFSEMRNILNNIYINNQLILIRRAFNDALKPLGILCLSEKWDCPSMWAHYADAHDGKQKGVVFGINTCDTDVNSVIKLTPPSGPNIRHVRYTKKHPVFIDEKFLVDFIIFRHNKPQHEVFLKWLNHNVIFHTIYSKSHDWKYEKEYRCLKHFGDKDIRFDFHTNLPKTQFSEIIIGKDIDPEAEKNILNLVKNNNLQTKVVKISGYRIDYGYFKDKVLLDTSNRK